MSIAKHVARVAGLSLALILATACAEERSPINRVQADALAKSFFVGALDDPDDDPEFFHRVTVVDTAHGAGSDGLFTNSDAQPTTRVRFEITEDVLLARLTYERIADTDGTGLRRTADGQVVAAYAIRKHFDIRHEYNPSTGEELNVIVENDSDRPWYERAHFRVDWSRNLVTEAYELDTLSQLGIYYGVEWEPVAYFVNDPDHPHAPLFDPARGYFDVTNKAFATPEVIEDEWWGDYPACWLVGAFPEVNCNSSEVTLRQAFLRVGERDYEPLEYDGAQMEMFGLFTVDRLGYDRRYGVVDDKWHRFASRWNLYQASHGEVPCNTLETTPVGADPNRDDDGNGTEDECEAIGRGSRCDRFVGACTIPLRDRQVRTIAWHVNRDFPADLWDGTAAALAAWNDAVRQALVAGRLAECRRTGEQGCEGQMQWPQRWSDDYAPPIGANGPHEVPNVFVLCHNPVDPALGDDPALCGAAGTSPRIGDLRYNLISVVVQHQLMSPWGIMMDVEDPLSGEKIAGSVTLWSATLDRAAATLVDLLALLNGQIAPDEYIEGEDISEWVKANQLKSIEERGAPAMSVAEIASRRAAFDPKVLEPYVAGLAAPKAGAHPKLRRQARARALVDHGRLGPGNSALGERLRRLRGSGIEAQLISPEMMQAGGFDPTGPLSPDAVRRGSPFGRMNPAARREQQRAGRLGRARRHSCRFEAPEADNMIALARWAQVLFPAPDPFDAAAVHAHREQVFAWARQEFNKGVMAHELGHSMGLRHNFAASFDSMSYAQPYWQLRTSNGQVTADCPDGNVDGSGCVGPRWRDPLSQEEIDGNINRYATSSGMEYPGDQNQDMVLPGKYDRAAMRLAYGGVVDVWNEPGLSATPGQPQRQKAFHLAAMAANPGLFGVYYLPPAVPGDPYSYRHYSRYQNEFGLIRDCGPAADPADGVFGVACLGPPLDVVDLRDMEDFIDDPDYGAFDWAYISKAIDQQGRPRRGYQFSSDEYADAGNVPAFSMDAGADAYEQVRFLESLYENRYVLDAFRRNRVSFNSFDTTWRIQARYLDNIQQIAKTFAFGVLLEGDPTQPTAETLQDGFYGPLEMASTVALDMFGRILTRPEPGYYCPIDACGGVQPLGVDSEIYAADFAALPNLYLYDFRVALGDGRYLHNDYDYAQGYWWGDYQTQVGAYYDKIWATYYLAEAFDYFISSAKEDFTDSRYKNVNFATVFPSQVRRLFNALLTGDYETYAPWVLPAGAGGDTPLGTVSYPVWHDASASLGRPQGALLVDPNHAWNEQIYAMVWGSIFFPTNWSQAFIHEARITTDFDFPGWPDAETYAFYHPTTGTTYYAHTRGSESVMGQLRQRSAGARMLEWANELLARAYLVDRDVNGAPLLDLYGTPILLLDVNGQPQPDPANPGADAVLQRYVDNIDMMRQLTQTFALPLGDGDLPQP
jgi:hypothetical protein